MSTQATLSTAETIVRTTGRPAAPGCALTTGTASPSFIEIRESLTSHPIRGANQATGKKIR
jgi:hypothetical protein